MKKNNHVGAWGAGIAAVAAAAAAGAYFLYGKDGAKNRKKIKSWSLKAKAEVLEKLERAKELNEDAYNQIVDAVSKKYAAVKAIDPTELDLLVKELKGHWRRIARDMKQGEKKVSQKK